MPLTSISIEQIAPDHWNGEVEVGALVAKRQRVRGSSFRDVMQAIDAAYSEMAGIAKPTLREVALKAMQDEDREAAAKINRRREAGLKGAEARWGAR